MKRTVLTTVISSLLAFATTNAMATSVKTAPASVTEAQHRTAIASENYHAALTTFNAAPSSERAYAAEKLETAHNIYTTAVLAEKVAIKQWLTPDLNVAPTQVAASPVATPSLAPQATPVSHAVPVAPAALNAPQAVPQATPAAVPSAISATPASPVAQKEINVPHMGTYSAPSLLQRNPTAPAIPTVSMPHVEVVNSVPAPRGNYGDTRIVNPQSVVTTTTLVTNVPAPSMNLPTQLAQTQKAPNAPVYNVPAEQKTPLAITQSTPSKSPAARVDQIAPAYPKSPVIATPYAVPAPVAITAAIPTAGKVPATPTPHTAPQILQQTPAAPAVPATPENTGAPKNMMAYSAPLPVSAPVARVEEVAQAPVAAPYHTPVGKETVGQQSGRQANVSSRLVLNANNSAGATAVDHTLDINKVDTAVFRKATNDLKAGIDANEKEIASTNSTVSSLGKVVGKNTKDIADNAAITGAKLNALAGSTHAMDVDLQKQIDKTADYTDTAVNKALDYTDTAVEVANNYTDTAVKVESDRAEQSESKLAHGVAEAITDAATAQDNAIAYTDQAVSGAMDHTDKALDTAVQYTDDAVNAEAANTNNLLATKATQTNVTTQVNAAQDATVAYTDQAIDQAYTYTDTVVEGAHTYTDQAVKVETDRASTAEAVNKATADKAQTTADTNNKLITTNTSGVAANKAAAATNAADVATNKAMIGANSTAITTETARAEKAEQSNTTAISTMTTSVNANTAGVAANRRDIDTTSTQVNKNTRTLANHEQRITTLEQQNNRQFGALKNQIDENHKEAMAGASSALAASQIPQVSANRDFSVGAGAGTYGGESAVAVGFSARINDRVVTKFAVTGDTQQKFGAGAGVSWEFGG